VEILLKINRLKYFLFFIFYIFIMVKQMVKKNENGSQADAACRLSDCGGFGYSFISTEIFSSARRRRELHRSI